MDKKNNENNNVNFRQGLDDQDDDSQSSKNNPDQKSNSVENGSGGDDGAIINELQNRFGPDAEIIRIGSINSEDIEGEIDPSNPEFMKALMGAILGNTKTQYDQDGNPLTERAAMNLTRKNTADKVDSQPGDTLRLIIPGILGLMHNYHTGKHLPLDDDGDPPKFIGLAALFSKITLLENIDEKPFKCDNCDEIHHHNCIVRIEDLDMMFYAARFYFVNESKGQKNHVLPYITGEKK